MTLLLKFAPLILGFIIGWFCGGWIRENLDYYWSSHTLMFVLGWVCADWFRRWWWRWSP